MKRIKIGFVVNNLVVGGVSAVLIKLCNQLNQDKYDVHLLVLSNDLQMEEVIPLNPTIKKHLFDYTFLNSFSLKSYLQAAFIPKQTEKRAAAVLSKIKSLNLDILHFHTLSRQLIIGHLAKKENPNLKLVFTDHLLRISEGQYKKHQRILLLLALKQFYKGYHLIAVSKAVYDFISKNNFQSKRLELLENSISIEEYNRSSSINSAVENRFIYVSRMNHHKGQDTLIKAWKKITLADKGKLILVGPDETNGSFHQMAEGDSSIIFTGSTSKVKEYLNQSTIAVFPSQKEGLPIALLEMMAFELPVICSDIPELTNIITDQKEGLHFKLDNIENLVEKLTFALKHKEEMIQMGKNARLKVETICEANNSINFHDKFYASLLS